VFVGLTEIVSGPMSLTLIFLSWKGVWEWNIANSNVQHMFDIKQS